jgi:tryptophanyl-tRNA synthetase
MGQLHRMTQFKDKSDKAKSVNAGLFTYPSLMAADILLYRADLVPVGEDQKQHIELCRDLVGIFDHRYGKDILKMPEPFIPKVGARIMSLQEPDKKMSKSDENPKNFVSVIEDDKSIEKKIKAATTDLETEVKFNLEKKPGISNLLTIYSVLSGKTIPELETQYQGKMYGHLKVDLAEVVIQKLRPVREKYQDLMKNKDHLNALMKAGREKAQARAQKTLHAVYEATGLVR